MKHRIKEIGEVSHNETNGDQRQIGSGNTLFDRFVKLNELSTMIKDPYVLSLIRSYLTDEDFNSLIRNRVDSEFFEYFTDSNLQRDHAKYSNKRFTDAEWSIHKSKYITGLSKHAFMNLRFLGNEISAPLEDFNPNYQAVGNVGIFISSDADNNLTFRFPTKTIHQYLAFSYFRNNPMKNMDELKTFLSVLRRRKDVSCYKIFFGCLGNFIEEGRNNDGSVLIKDTDILKCCNESVKSEVRRYLFDCK